MNKQKGRVLLIVLIIAAAIGGYFIYTNYSNNRTKPVQQTSQPSPTPSDETANWKTYQSKEYNFQIKYPSTVKAEEKEVVTNQQQIYNKSHLYLTIDGGVLEIYGVCGRGAQPIKQQDIVIAGQKTIKFYETEITGAIAAIPRPNSNESICFNFQLPKDSSKTQVVDDLFNQILSTFKFTN